MAQADQPEVSQSSPRPPWLDLRPIAGPPTTPWLSRGAQALNENSTPNGQQRGYNARTGQAICTTSPSTSPPASHQAQVDQGSRPAGAECSS
jgi:hypothetical protein